MDDCTLFLRLYSSVEGEFSSSAFVFAHRRFPVDVCEPPPPP